MAAEPGDIRPSSLDVAIERALTDVSRAVELELAEVAQNIDLLDEQYRGRIGQLGEQLVRIARGSEYMLGSVARTPGIELGVSTPVAPPPPPQPPAARALVPTPEVGTQTGNGASAAEQEEGVDKDSLYVGIVGLERIPTMALKEGAPAITVSILNRNKLGVGQRSITLKGHEVYLFNALMILRDKARAAEELRGFNFAPNVSNGTAQIAFNKAMNSLSTQLNGAAGLEVIKRVSQGRGTRYAVNPNLVLEDLRTDEVIAAEDGAAVKKK